MMPKIDKSGKFCSRRAARELALLIIYAACLEASEPVRLFEKRVNSRRGFVVGYNSMSFGRPPVMTETAEEADDLMRNDEEESAIEAEVLSAPPKLVYSKLLLQFTRKLLVAVVDKWDNHASVIDKVVPPNWKAVDLAKRFCDGAAPHIIIGCLRTFMRDLEETAKTEAS